MWQKNIKTILFKDKCGMALVTTLILSLIGMLMVLSLYYMVQTGVWTSGAQKRYQTALETSHGVLNIFTKEIIQRGIGGTNLSAMISDYSGADLSTSAAISDSSFKTKLTSTGNWTTNDVTFTITFPTPLPNMTVTASLADASRGNSSTSANELEGGGVTAGNTGSVTPQHIPYLYDINVQAQSAVNPRERANLSALYAY